MNRIFRHLLSPSWHVRQAFPEHVMLAIERAIREAEASHQGQIRFAVETSLELAPLLKNQSARERAIEVFSQLRIWDTEQNNGVLIYLLLADHDVEIVADRGVHRMVGEQNWEAVCREMEAAFRKKQFEAGVVAGIQAVSAHLAHYFPPGHRAQANELPDTPVVL